MSRLFLKGKPAVPEPAYACSLNVMFLLLKRFLATQSALLIPSHLFKGHRASHQVAQELSLIILTLGCGSGLPSWAFRDIPTDRKPGRFGALRFRRKVNGRCQVSGGDQKGRYILVYIYMSRSGTMPIHNTQTYIIPNIIPYYCITGITHNYWHIL